MTCCCQDTAPGTWPARLDLPLQQGDDFSVTLELLEAGGPMDLTGATFEAVARRRKADAAPAFVYACAVELPATDGKVTLSLDAATTAGVACGDAPTDTASRYVWALRMTKAGVSRTLYEGIVLVNGDVNHA
jgi:hypothetical protein